jgi:hypothetical protein
MTASNSTAAINGGMAKRALENKGTEVDCVAFQGLRLPWVANACSAVVVL